MSYSDHFGGGGWSGMAEYLQIKNDKIKNQLNETTAKKSALFADCVFMIDGETRVLDTVLRQLITQHGGLYEYHNLRNVTHFVVDNIAIGAGRWRRIRTLVKTKFAIVKSDWILDSIKNNKRLLEYDYRPAQLLEPYAKDTASLAKFLKQPKCATERNYRSPADHLVISSSSRIDPYQTTQSDHSIGGMMSSPVGENGPISTNRDNDATPSDHENLRSRIRRRQPDNPIVDIEPPRKLLRGASFQARVCTEDKISETRDPVGKSEMDVQWDDLDDVPISPIESTSAQADEQRLSSFQMTVEPTTPVRCDSTPHLTPAVGRTRNGPLMLTQHTSRPSSDIDSSASAEAEESFRRAQYHRQPDAEYSAGEPTSGNNFAPDLTRSAQTIEVDTSPLCSNARSNSPGCSSQRRHFSDKDPEFVKNFFKNSRLHFIGRWKDRLMKKFKFVDLIDTPQEETVWTPVRFLHIDFDEFFVSVALKQVENREELKFKPLGVGHGSSLSSTSELASCNYLARGFGVKKGMYIARARELCPELTILPYNFAEIENCGDELLNILSLVTPRILPISCDEAYVQLVGDYQVNRSLFIAQWIRYQAELVTKCRVSIGIGDSMLCAKTANKMAKPDQANSGIYIIPAPKCYNVSEISAEEYLDLALERIRTRPVTENNLLLREIESSKSRRQIISEFFAEQLIQDLHGIGPSTQQILEQHGIRNCRDIIMKLDCQKLQSLLGAEKGSQIFYMAQGIDNRKIPIHAVSEKSVTVSVNWGVRLYNKQQVNHFLFQMAQESASRIAHKDLAANSLGIKVLIRAPGQPVSPFKYGGCGICEWIVKKMDIPPSHNTQHLTMAALRLWNQQIRVNIPDIRGVSFTLGKFTPLSKLKSQPTILESLRKVGLRNTTAAPAALPAAEIAQSKSPPKRVTVIPPFFTQRLNDTDSTASDPQRNNVVSTKTLPQDSRLSVPQQLSLESTFARARENVVVISDDEIEKDEDQLVPGQAVELVPGQAVELVPGQAVELVPDHAVKLVPGQAVELVPGQAVELVPDQAVELVEKEEDRLVEDQVGCLQDCVCINCCIRDLYNSWDRDALAFECAVDRVVAKKWESLILNSDHLSKNIGFCDSVLDSLALRKKNNRRPMCIEDAWGGFDPARRG